MRILLIEDEKRIAGFIARGLEESGYTVDAAATGQDGLNMVTGATYELVILDLMLPDLDGLVVLEKIRLRKASQPVLILSARGNLEDRVKGLDLGADDYLVKPFAFVELLARIRALLRRGQSLPERLQVEDLVLDCLRRKVSRAGANIELAPKEFSILEYLMRNKGRALSRTMIVEHVWEMDYTGLTNIVDVYIRHLRGKVDDDWPQKLIKTVRGIGYMIGAAEETEPPALTSVSE
jgi:two-component system copper resistance phosphate regulon response regulator CusR